MPRVPPSDPVVCATVPARAALKDSPARWLTNLARRALEECWAGRTAGSETAVLLALPEAHRVTSAWRRDPGVALEAIARAWRRDIHPASASFQSGSAGAIEMLITARQLLQSGAVRHCLVGAVDTLVTPAEVVRLQAAGRLQDGAANPQGLIPGEGAAFVLLGLRGQGPTATSLAEILGLGVAQEDDTVLSDRYSRGLAARQALAIAMSESGRDEANVDLRVSDMNGERYRAWESMLSTTRFYRTRREHLPTWYPARSVGDIGAAAGMLGLVVAVIGMARGYAPGPTAMCESSSEAGLRGACVVSSGHGAPVPPFRSKAQAPGNP